MNRSLFSVADTDRGSGAFLTPGSGMCKKSGSGSVMNNPDHISQSQNIFFGLKYLHSFYVYPGSGLDKIRVRDPGWKEIGTGIRDKHPGSATLPLLFLKTQIQERLTHLAYGVVLVVQHVAEGGQQLRPLRHLTCTVIYIWSI
jgi:hypothetical protein